jgi:hypothetical protein
MLSAVILAHDEPPAPQPEVRARRVTRTLGALIALVVADIVGDAQIIARRGHDFAALADRAGCSVVAEDDPDRALAQSLHRARRPDILLIRAGYAPDRGFADEIGMMAEDAVGGLPPRALHRDADTFIQRLWPQRAPVVGLVASRDTLQATNTTCRDLRRLARTLSAVPLHSRAIKLS